MRIIIQDDDEDQAQIRADSISCSCVDQEPLSASDPATPPTLSLSTKRGYATRQAELWIFPLISWNTSSALDLSKFANT